MVTPLIVSVLAVALTLGVVVIAKSRSKSVFRESVLAEAQAARHKILNTMGVGAQAYWEKMHPKDKLSAVFPNKTSSQLSELLDKLDELGLRLELPYRIYDEIEVSKAR